MGKREEKRSNFSLQKHTFVAFPFKKKKTEKASSGSWVVVMLAVVTHLTDRGQHTA